MSALLIATIASVVVFGGALLGMYVRSALPEGHLRDDVKDVVRLSTGLIGTITALVLGLLIASAKSSYDARDSQVKQITTKVILLDVLVEQYGPEARNLRVMLRGAIGSFVDRIWNEGGHAKAAPFVASADAETFIKKLQELTPEQRLKTCSSDASDKCYRRFSTSALVAVCPDARFNSRTFSRNPHFFGWQLFLLVSVCLCGPVRSLSSRFPSVRYQSQPVHPGSFRCA